MDYFLTSAAPATGPDSLSLQEMLDMDIKSENDYESVFNCGDMNLNFSELPALNLDEDSLGAPGDNNVWLTSSNDSHSLLGGDINNSLSQDLSSGETRMVCPNSVMPVTLIQVPYDDSEKKEKSLLKPLVSKNSVNNNLVTKIEIKEEPCDLYDSEPEDYEEVYARALAFKNSQANRTKVRVSSLNTARSITHSSNGTKRPVPLKSVNPKRRVQEYSNSIDGEFTVSAYPKPAYSYSCLIAMALKNSPSGSLPVSEIYNFMCEHFPYFKTAPNGWKNSVRHNLSLNKCFEKIEKPATNGSQRKGCLWAMNPNKINKMDEEVQKWSKKDKSAIRKSMIYPESLDALERGELSGGGCGVGTSEGDSEEDGWEPSPVQNWCYKRETDDEDEEDEEDSKAGWEGHSRVKGQTFFTEEDLEDSDISLTDFDIEIAESMCNEEVGKVNVRVNVQTSPNVTFQPLLTGAYTVKTPSLVENSPKRFKTSGGSTITGNYVYKPFGATTVRRKSPVRHALLSSLEADD